MLDNFVSFTLSRMIHLLAFTRWRDHMLLTHSCDSALLYTLQKVHQNLSTTFLTRSSADADKPARGVYMSVKIIKHSTIPYVRYSFLLVLNSNFVFKMRRFSDIRLQKWRDLEIRVRGHSRSLKRYHSTDWVWFHISVL